MKKSILSLLLVMILGLVLAATACGKNDESGKDSEPSSSGVSEVSENLTVSEKEKTLRVGESYKIETDGEGKPTFVSSDISVAEVSADGTVTAVSDGTTFITVSNEKAEVTCRINVIKENDYIRLGRTEIGVVKGGEATVEAEIIENGETVKGEISFTADGNDLKIAQNGNSVTLSSDKTGYYAVTARYKALTAKITVKVVNENAKTLDTPVLTTENCETLKWNAVNFADGYKVSVNGGTATDVRGTAFDVSEYTKDLEYGEKAVFAVSAVAKNNFYCLDGLPERLVFGHNYKEEVIEPYTCTTAGKVKYVCADCGKNYEKDGVLAPHKIVDGACEVCGKAVTEKVLYLYDKDNDCYYVAGGDAGFDAEEVYILAKYDDGKNGEHPVKYFGCGAFQFNETIKRVIVPESMTEFVDAKEEFNIINLNGKKVSSPLRGLTFDGCINLEFVSVPGMHYFPAVDKSELPYHHDNFRDCYKLTQIVVGDGFYNEGRSFMNWLYTPENYVPKTDIYVYGTNVTAIATDSYLIGTSSGANNNLLSGDVFYYDETSTKCFTWHYGENGEVVTNGKHDYRKGVCRKCGARNDYGVSYAYDSENECYYVGDNKTISYEEIEILPEFDDGANGVHPVTYIKNGAFKTNIKLKKVILPESITTLDGSVFENCTSLEYVSMTGIKGMKFDNIDRVYSDEKVTTNNNFLNCFALKTLIVSKDFDLYVDSPNAQQFIGTGENLFEPRVDIYVDASFEESNVHCDKSRENNLLTGVVFYKGALTTCRRWTMNENGEIKTSARDHSLVNGKCEICGFYETNGVMYGYDGGNNVYYVSGYVGSDAEVIVLEKYDDGKNGEHPVTFVKNSAFIDNYSITKVILPASVKRLDGSVFQNCGNLRYVSMPGIEDMIFANINVPYSDGVVTTNNNFLGCVKLTVLIVGEKFNLHPNGGGEQQFVKQGNTPCVDIYVYGTSVVDCSVGDDAKNGLLTGNVYYYNETKAENCWRYVDGEAEKW